jgi:hypothetical protein
MLIMYFIHYILTNMIAMSPYGYGDIANHISNFVFL